MELALGRVPALRTAGVKQLINGPESFTPDGNWIIGEAPETRGVFVGAGFNAFGIAWRRRRDGLGRVGGQGRAALRRLAVDIRRFGRNHLDTDWVRTRTLEAYAKHYAMAWRTKSTAPADLCAARRSGSGSRTRGRVSAKSWARSGPTGSLSPARSRSTA